MCPINSNSPIGVGGAISSVSPGVSGASASLVDSGSVSALSSAFAPRDSRLIDGPAPMTGTTVPGIAESFPVNALSQIDGRSVQGETFLLDAGSLRGLKLRLRRVQDADKPGFEVIFRLTDSKIAALAKRMTKKAASKSAVVFRGTEEGDDGLVRYSEKKATITKSSMHAPEDTKHAANEWALKVMGQKGGEIELVSEDAAMALRGLVRIDLRGTDVECTAQLNDLIKSLGLGFIFAPPTTKSKQVNLLMRVLFQHDHKKAGELSKGDLSKLKIEDLESALKATGFTQERINGLRYEEVFNGHFTVIDPEHANEMAKAGARYLYSTVRSAEHVASMLRNGLKSSMQRYFEGDIINGMSTNSDFSTGGAVGVFTRMVTQDAIYAEQSWTGGIFKLIQSHTQLARSDWYGWNADKFGKRWDLTSEDNFGESLVAHVDDNGSYKRTNEVIFTAGVRPESIERVVATDEKNREALIDVLKKEGFVPHNGLSIEDFVILEPNFFVFGPSPYECDDPKAFAKNAMKEAKAGNPNALKWFLIEGPETAIKERAKAEQNILLQDDQDLLKTVIQSAKMSGSLAMSKTQLDEVLKELGKADNREGAKVLKQLTTNCAEALLGSNSKEAIKIFEATAADSTNYRLHGLTDDKWVRLIANLAKQQNGESWSKSLAYALKNRGEHLLSRNNEGFMALLRKTSLVDTKPSAAWIKSEIKNIKDTSKPSLEFNLYLGQISHDKKLAKVQENLLLADHPETNKVFFRSMTYADGIKISPNKLLNNLNTLPGDSTLKKALFEKHSAELIKLGSTEILDLLSKHHDGDSNLGLSSYQMKNLIDEMLDASNDSPTPYLVSLMEKNGSVLLRDPSFLQRMTQLGELYDFSAPAAFTKQALKNLEPGQTGQFQLAAMMMSETIKPERKQKTLAAMMTSADPQAQLLAKRLLRSDDNAKTLVTTEVMHGVFKSLEAEHPEKAKIVLETSGSALLASAKKSQLPLFETHLDQNNWPLNAFGLQPSQLISVLESFDKTGSEDASIVRNWILKHGAEKLLSLDSDEVAAYLNKHKLKPKDLGLDQKTSASIIQTLVFARRSSFTGSSWAASDKKDSLPASAIWLFKDGGKTYDDKVLAEVVKDLKSWKAKKPLLDAFIERLPGLSESWQKKLAKAAKKAAI